MKNYKILENRPELTNEQIMQGMDFNKIKNNVSIAKSGLLKSLIIKGFFGVAVISSVLVIYKNYTPSTKEKTEAILLDSKKTISRNKKEPSAIATNEIAVKKTATIVKNKSTINNLVVAPNLPKDTNAIIEATVNNWGIKNTTYTDKRNAYFEEKTDTAYKLNSFAKAFGPDDIKEINKSFAKINDMLYASKYEVSNKLYMLFLSSLKQSTNSNLLSIAKIDTLKWLEKLSYNKPYVQYYHTHAAYQKYPVVNISYDAAKLFCEWLTIQYNSSPKRKFKKVLFRFPTEKEWVIAAQAGDTSAIYPWRGTELRNKKGQIMCNFKGDIKDSLWIDGKGLVNVDVTAPINSYWKNNFGLYNMSGNVAEMINEKGVAKGGSWSENAEYLKIDAKLKYDGKAQVFVGFRYFIEVIEK